NADRVVRFVARVALVGHVAEVDERVELRIDLRADVGAEAVQQTRIRAQLPRVDRDAERIPPIALVLVELENADPGVAPRRHEVRNGFSAARHLQAGRLAIAGTERRDGRIGDRIVDANAAVSGRAVRLLAASLGDVYQ